MRYIILGLGLAAIVAVALVAMPPKQTNIAVRSLIERDDLVLEIADVAWVVSEAGGVSVNDLFSLPVRLVGRTDCHIYADFVAAAGSGWVIYLNADGSTTLRQPEVMQGPGLGRTTTLTNCPRD